MYDKLSLELRSLLRAARRAQEEGDPFKRRKLCEDDQRHVPYLVTLNLIEVGELSDEISVTTEGRLFVGIRPDGHMDLPVEVAELTGNIEERELAARYIDAKIAGTDRHIRETGNPTYREAYEHVGIVLKCIADEFRKGMHLPAAQAPEARVIPYNENTDTGVRHEAALRLFYSDVHERNVKAGWWSDIQTGQPKKRSVGELFILFVTEMAEAYDAWLMGETDDKLPQFPGIGVELADLQIRLADFCGALRAGRIIAGYPAHNPGDMMFRKIVDIATEYEAIRKSPVSIGDPERADFLPSMDAAQMVDAKLAFNAVRPDHKIEARLADDGKRT